MSSAEMGDRVRGLLRRQSLTDLVESESRGGELGLGCCPLSQTKGGRPVGTSPSSSARPICCGDLAGPLRRRPFVLDVGFYVPHSVLDMLHMLTLLLA